MSRTILYPESIIDGTATEPVRNHAVVVVDGFIDSVTPASRIDIADDDIELHLSGLALIPGLINNHVHLELPQTIALHLLRRGHA